MDPVDEKQGSYATRTPMTRHLHALAMDFPSCKCGHFEIHHAKGGKKMCTVGHKIRVYQKGPLYKTIEVTATGTPPKEDGPCPCTQFRKQRVPQPKCFCGHVLSRHTGTLKLKGDHIAKQVCTAKKCACFGYDDERK